MFRKMNKKTVNWTLAIAATALLSGCGKSSSGNPAVGGIGAGIGGAIGCAAGGFSINGPIPFSGSGKYAAYVDGTYYAGILAGPVPSTDPWSPSATGTALVVGGGITGGQYTSSGAAPDAQVSMNMQRTSLELGSGAVNIQGSMLLRSSVINNLQMWVRSKTSGYNGGGYNGGEYNGGAPNGIYGGTQDICVHGIAISAMMDLTHNRIFRTERISLYLPVGSALPPGPHAAYLYVNGISEPYPLQF